MLSYTTRRNRFGKLTGDDSSANLTLGDELMNDADRRILALHQWPFLLKTRSFTTTTNQSTLTLPHAVKKITNLFVLIGSTRYPVQPIHDRQKWIEITQTPNDSADYPDYFYLRGNVIEFWPRISTASNTITVEYVARQKDLSVADYTTGTISAIENGKTTVTGSGTSWTSQMAGRFIRITDGNSAGSGDGEWYEISSVTSATELELVGAYQGTTISAGSAAYVIGQMSLIPEEYNKVSLFEALEEYFMSGVDPKMEQADRYGKKRDELIAQMKQDYSLFFGSVAVADDDVEIINTNNYPRSIG